MPTKERVTQVAINRELKKDHHPFLDKMQESFTPEKFRCVLDATKKRYQTYNPPGEVPVYDQDVLGKVDIVMREVKDINKKFSKEDEKDIRAAALFAIWAHGTDTRFQDKRFRHERKDDGSPQPYAIHLARVAERLTDFDPMTIQVAFLHDVLENTRYTEDDLMNIFGSEVAKACRKVSKISTDTLEDLGQMEIQVARDFLDQFRQDEAIDGIVKYLDKAIKETPYTKNISVAKFEELYPVSMYFRGKKLITDTLRKVATSEDEAQMLTLMRLLSVFEKESDIRALIVKCADVADNMSSIEGLVTGKGRERAEQKAKIAQNVFAPLARVLGLDQIALDIEEQTFFVLESQAAQKIAGKLEKKDRFEIKKTTEEKIKQLKMDFIRWANDRSEDIIFSEDSIKVAVRYPNACEIHNHQIELKSKIPPLIEIYIRDKFTAHAFYEFLREVGSATNTNVTAGSVTNVYGDRVKKADFRFIADRSRRNLLGFIYDCSGDITDLFRPISESEQKSNASDNVKNVIARLRSGDFSDFLSDLNSGKRVRITIASGTASRTLFVPKNATADDALIMAGLGRSFPTVVRNGTKVPDEHLQHGDIIELSARTDGTSLYYPATIDRLVTPAARNRLSLELKDILTSNYDDRKDLVRLGARIRGIRILTALSDIKAAQLMYRSFDANPYKKNFFESLFRFHRTLIKDPVQDDLLISLGIAPLVFPSDQLSVTPEIYKEWQEIPLLESTLNKLMSWVSDNCYEIRPSGGFGKEMGGSANSREVSLALGNYIKRLYENSEGVLREIIYVPVDEGQILPDYPFYIAIDSSQLKEYAARNSMAEGEALNHLFGKANKVIRKFSD